MYFWFCLKLSLAFLIRPRSERWIYNGRQLIRRQFRQTLIWILIFRKALSTGRRYVGTCFLGPNLFRWKCFLIYILSYTSAVFSFVLKIVRIFSNVRLTVWNLFGLLSPVQSWIHDFHSAVKGEEKKLENLSWFHIFFTLTYPKEDWDTNKTYFWFRV